YATFHVVARHRVAGVASRYDDRRVTFAAEQRTHWHPEHVRDLAGVRGQPRLAANGEGERGDGQRRQTGVAGGHGLERSQQGGVPIEIQSELFLGLALRREQRARVTRLAAPTGEGQVTRPRVAVVER